ncbi:site-specific DNA-methyltransferase [Ectothiorhodospiraceae bacterium BW-2]|nr:site-specific DNA-methyltransferase [Ectothiorhodospiraceae bacterium BW-2]
MENHLESLKEQILALLPADGSQVGNQAIVRALRDGGTAISDDAYFAVKEELITAGLVGRGRGKGGAIYRIQSEPAKESLTLETESAPPAQAILELTAPVPPAPKPQKPRATLKKAANKQKASDEKAVIAYRHSDKRKNNPEVGMVTPGNDADDHQTEWHYDPHIDPSLQFDVGRADIEQLIDEALESGDADTMRAALEELKRASQPYLNWSGKAERTSFEVDTVSLHVHERIDPASILAVVSKQIKAAKRGKKPQNDWRQGDLFAAPFENLPLRDAIDFYKHDKGWSNRLIAGDSLLVMNSLLQKESMAGKVQMIYIDPPYGIKYGSNFQPFVNKRDVKDRKDEDLTREPETIKAFRDTWELGIHSYLTYLRDRLLLAKELLHESGSVFVQISDENVHHVRELMDELYGVNNFIGIISFRKTTGQTGDFLPDTNDYIIWYGKNRDTTKFNNLFQERTGFGWVNYNYVLTKDGQHRKLTKKELTDPKVNLSDQSTIYRRSPVTSTSKSESTSVNINFQYNIFSPGKGGWKTNQYGFSKLEKTNRLESYGTTLSYRRYTSDFPYFPFSNSWIDTASGGYGADKVYVVQTNEKVIERCLLMTTDPGDLVLDPTCGSGTTAFVAEKWGRRWITCDTSRVALTLAKQRLMTASFDYYPLRYPQEGLKSGFIYKTVPHITLKSIANNPEIDEIYARMHPAIDTALAALNRSIKGHTTPFKVTEGGRKGKTIDFTAADSKTMTLPSGETAQVNQLLEWEVPFDRPDDWPETTQAPFAAFHAARQAMQKQMDASISDHADQEILYDQPAIDKSKLRITGPFSVEAVPSPSVKSLDEALPTTEADSTIARSGETSRQQQWRDELLKSGIRGKGGEQLKFAELETLAGTRHLHASGTLIDSHDRVVISFGPEHTALEQRQVANALNEAGELFPQPKMIIFCTFAFDPEAAKDIDHLKGITALKAQMNPDLFTDDLKSNKQSNQSFWLMGQPDVELHRLKEGRFQIEVHGFDYFDPKSGELKSGGKGNIAMWSLDVDYDDRSLFPSQIFFPMAGAKDGWNRLKKDIRAELDEAQLDRFHGTKSLPFEAGENRKAAVKIVDDRGIESLKIIDLVG